jgi:hypothetical protein
MNTMIVFCLLLVLLGSVGDARAQERKNSCYPNIRPKRYRHTSRNRNCTLGSNNGDMVSLRSGVSRRR